ncbi:hypothetical protein Kpol_1039p47 [Vanderwaltozyma polyspora DSM 70294]|uniref:Ribosomal protein bL31m N-terminal domain-containing protein n=1 Tax=Vanderwaltozyma polyspora (strain ATCC 22028 / DSM 70294 / BCRC 21397 / CBS 2163 / NBRC 10782 / NRRL Y-8283 / UCD 57-17) TaxID=436907 RepID=A7THH2_VANPO|nr:uncharacterized protein Kpol_1039p47 [Vanderwaltozyma polyspora DSM 70294]EDO18296.1 hypothetical protein Kpol_1039p47 [Vanderwaltozyma polyspora DSM 70294]
MLRNLISVRFSSNVAAAFNAPSVSLPRRPMKKIRLGKSRPAIYHQFDVLVELSDGSVIKRRSQFPKDEYRLIQDQRNNPLWNKSRDDLVIVDANSGGSLDRFKKKYSSIFTVESTEAPVETKKDVSKSPKKIEVKEVSAQEDEFGVDDYLSLLNDDESQIKTGNLAVKKRSKK